MTRLKYKEYYKERQRIRAMIEQLGFTTDDPLEEHYTLIRNGKKMTFYLEDLKIRLYPKSSTYAHSKVKKIFSEAHLKEEILKYFGL